MTTATLTRPEEIHAEVEQEETTQESAKTSRRGNVFMRRLEPDMLTSPYPIEAVDGMMSNDFCYEKAFRDFLKPLQFQSEKDWLEFCKHVWVWGQELENREIEARVNELLRELELDPKVAAKLREKISQKK